MKKGFLFFLNMGFITTVARFLIIPAFIGGITFQFHTIFYKLSWIIFVISLILAMIPAPSDKVAEKVIKEFQTEFNQRLLNCCKPQIGEPIILKGYEKHGKMILRRQLGKNVIYPHLAAIGFCKAKNRTVLIIARKSLLSSELTKYQEIECNSNSRFCVEANAIDNDENEIELNFSIEGTENKIVMYVKSDYHYRDLLAAIHDFLKNDG